MTELKKITTQANHDVTHDVNYDVKYDVNYDFKYDVNHDVNNLPIYIKNSNELLGFHTCCHGSVDVFHDPFEKLRINMLRKGITSNIGLKTGGNA